MSLMDVLLESEDVLKPFKFLDVLPYYSVISSFLTDFLRKKELASKVWIPHGPLILKRGSKLQPIYVDELSRLSSDLGFFEEKRKMHLSDARGSIDELQDRAWNYFPPRKLADFYYATNGEGKNKPIERIFFDIDRGLGISAEDARLVTKAFVEELESNDELSSKIGSFRTFVMWTGHSFHVYVFPNKNLDPDFYRRYLSYSKSVPSLFNLLEEMVKKVREKTRLNMVGGHEKGEGRVVIDPSQTPSGKLARCPFSLHMKDAKHVDGVALPLARDMLDDSNIVDDLKKQNPDSVIENLKWWARNLRF